jgi:Cupin
MTDGTSDPLSDVLRSVRLTGGLFLDAKFSAPWCIRARIGREECAPFMPRVLQVIGYHVILEGCLQIAVEGEPPVRVRAGEIVLLPRNDIHVMSSGPGLAEVNSTDLIRSSPDGGLLQIRHGGGNEPTSMVCGFLGTEDRFNPLLAALPGVLTLDIADAASREWVEASVRFAAEELIRGRLASSSVMSRLARCFSSKRCAHMHPLLATRLTDGCAA